MTHPILFRVTFKRILLHSRKLQINLMQVEMHLRLKAGSNCYMEYMEKNGNPCIQFLAFSIKLFWVMELRDP